jgi:hypothetical protein
MQRLLCIIEVIMSQEEIWKEESEQLKKDLNNRQKVVKKNEVPLQFGGKKKTSSRPSKPTKQTTASDDFLRRQLGL